MRILPLVCVLAGLAAADDRIDALGSDDPTAALKARAYFVRRGTLEMPKLQAALQGPASDKVKAAVRDLIAVIEKNEPRGLRFSVGLPKMALTHAFVNSEDFRFSINVQNRNAHAVTLFAYAKLRLLDVDGKPVKSKLRRGRWGLRRGEILDSLEFRTIAPGKTMRLDGSLALYMRHPELVVGWEVPAPGRYTLELTYVFDRKATKARCDPRWVPLNDPARDWNKAVELNHTFRQLLVVVP